MPAPHRILARRAARIGFGGVLLAGVVALVVAGWQSWSQGPFQLGHLRLSAAQIIGGTWYAAAVLSSAVFAGTWVAARRMRLRPEALFAASWVIPIAALALVLPITIHLLVGLAFGAADAGSFNGWVKTSLIVAGPAHLVFAGLCVKRTRQLLAGAAKVISRTRIYGLTVATSCVPFAVLFFIPPIVVALTGLPFIPLLSAMQRAIERERAELAALPHPLPRAIAAVPRGGASSRAG